MSKQAPDHRQRLLVHRRVAREGMPQVVKADARQTRSLSDAVPVALELAKLLPVAGAPEQPGHVAPLWQRVDNRASLVAEPHRARAGLAVAQLEAVALHITPLEVEDLAHAASCEQQQRDGRRHHRSQLVLARPVLRQNLAQPLHLRAAQEALAFALPVQSDGPARVGVLEPVAPALRLVEHVVEDGHDPVGTARAGLVIQLGKPLGDVRLVQLVDEDAGESLVEVMGAVGVLRLQGRWFPVRRPAAPILVQKVIETGCRADALAVCCGIAADGSVVSVA